MSLPIDAAKLIIKDKALLAWSLIPILITLVLYFWAIAWLQAEARAYLDGLFLGWGIDPESWIGTTVGILTALLLFVVSALTFTFSSTLVASPFNDILAEKTEKHTNPKLPEVGSPPFSHHFKVIWVDLIKTGATTAAGIAAFTLSLIPFVNLVTFGIAFLLVTFQYTSYPQSRREVGLREGARFLWTHLFACMGFGATITFFYAIPILSCLALPVAVVGGTLLAARAPGSPGLYRLK